MRKTMFILITLALTACLPGQNPVDIESRVNTAVAQTLEAREQIDGFVAQTVAAQSVLFTPTAEFTQTPTDTPIAIPTLTPIIFTITPLPVNPPSSGVSSQPLYACEVIKRRPFDNSEFDNGEQFDIKWTIVNIGTRTWLPGVDVKYYSGPKMVGGRVEIPKEMKPGDSFVINLDATAPDSKGFHVMTWAVDGPMCYPYTAIIVK